MLPLRGLTVSRRCLLPLARIKLTTSGGQCCRVALRSYSERGAGSGWFRGRFFRDASSRRGQGRGWWWWGHSVNRRPLMVTSLSLTALYSSKGKQHSLRAPSPILPNSVPIEMSRIMLPNDSNVYGNVHGGTILKLIEQTGAVVASRHCNRSSIGEQVSEPLIPVLARVEHMDFHQPMYVGEVAQLQAAVTFTSSRSMEVAVDVWAENVLTGERRHTNSARLWYAAFPADEDKLGKGDVKAVPVPSLKGQSKEDLEAGKTRYQTQKSQRAQNNISKGLTHYGAYFPASDTSEHTVNGSQTTLASIVHPSDCTSTGYLMGGSLMKMMDNAAGICAARHCRSGVVTACIDAIDFHHPVFKGEVVFCTARLVFCSSRSMEIEVITEAEGIRPGSRKVSNTAYFTFVSVGKEAKTRTVPQLKLSSEEEEKRFEEGRLRYEARKKARAGAAAGSNSGTSLK